MRPPSVLHAALLAWLMKNLLGTAEEAGARLGLPMLMPVDEAGHFYPNYGWLHGLSTGDAADQIVLAPSRRAVLLGASTPVVRSCDVVRMTGLVVSTSWKRLRCPRPISPSSEVTRQT